MFRFGWQKVDAKLIDQRFLRRDSYNVHNPSSSYQVWEYMIELEGPDGRPIRLTLDEKTFELNDPQIGDTVPVLVNRRRTKAAFDLDDPRISPAAAREAGERAQRERDEARFEAKRRELD